MDSGYMKQIRERILSAKNGMVFTTSDFADIADADAVRQSLNRLVNHGILRRVFRGVFEKPKYSNLRKEYVATNPNAVAHALARSYHWTIVPCGNTALYLSGLSDQRPTIWSYMSNGPYKTYEWDSIRIEFKHRTNKKFIELSYLALQKCSL